MGGGGTPERGAPRISLSQSNIFTCWPSIVTARRSSRIWPNGSFACPMLPSKTGAVLKPHPTPAERQPFEVVVLGGVVRDIELDKGGRGIRRHGQAADLARRRKIRIHQRRRHRQRAGDVVEPVG